MYVSNAKVNSIVAAHVGLPGMGAFPAPDIATVYAAEIVRRNLEHTGYRGTFAVSVSHVHNTASGHSNFVISFSGYHPDLHPNRRDTTRELNLELKEINHALADRVRVSYTNDLDAAYHPMHTTTQAVFTEIFAKTANITAVDVDNKLNAFRTLINWNALYIPATNSISINVPLKQITQIGKKEILGLGVCGLALRMGIIQPGDEATVVRSLRNFIKQLKLLKTRIPNGAAYQEIANLLETLLLSQKITVDNDSQIELVLDQKAYTVPTIEAARVRIVGAWGANAFGRFCAEPKGLSFARNISLIPDASVVVPRSRNFGYNFSQKGALQGQLAFWYSFTERRNFQGALFVHGGDVGDLTPGHGGYMKPCSSCASRSTYMMSGLLPPVLNLDAPASVGFDWMNSGELQLINELRRRYPGPLNHTSAQFLANTIIAKRRTLALPPENAEQLFIELARAQATRMSITLA